MPDRDMGSGALGGAALLPAGEEGEKKAQPRRQDLRDDGAPPHARLPPECGEDEEQDEHERGLGIHREIGKEGAFRRVKARRRHAREGVEEQPEEEDWQNGGDVPGDLLRRAEHRPDDPAQDKEQYAAQKRQQDGAKKRTLALFSGLPSP